VTDLFAGFDYGFEGVDSDFDLNYRSWAICILRDLYPDMSLCSLAKTGSFPEGSHRILYLRLEESSGSSLGEWKLL